MSQWNILDTLWKNSREYIVKNGDSWDIAYRFTLPTTSPDNIKYLVFTFGEEEEIHPCCRKINVINLGSTPTRVSVDTLINSEIDVLGNDISNKIINSNLNIDNSFNFSMYDETSTILSEGDSIPFSDTIVSDKKLASSDYIMREYIAPRGGTIVLKFENFGDSEVEIEYSAGGHRVKL